MDPFYFYFFVQGRPFRNNKVICQSVTNGTAVCFAHCVMELLDIKLLSINLSSCPDIHSVIQSITIGCNRPFHHNCQTLSDSPPRYNCREKLYSALQPVDSDEILPWYFFSATIVGVHSPLSGVYLSFSKTLLVLFKLLR